MPADHPHFSLNTLENYQFVNQIVLDVIQSYFSLQPELITADAPSMGPHCRHFCMAKPTQYDVVYRGLKVAGSAQRKRKQGYLHQGTISLMAPERGLLLDLLLSQEEVTQAMTTYTFAPLAELSQLEKTRDDLEKLLADKLKNALKS
jgi:lipoate-protein ligase A